MQLQRGLHPLEPPVKYLDDEKETAILTERGWRTEDGYHAGQPCRICDHDLGFDVPLRLNEGDGRYYAVHLACEEVDA